MSLRDIRANLPGNAAARSPTSAVEAYQDVNQST